MQQRPFLQVGMRGGQVTGWVSVLSLILLFGWQEWYPAHKNTVPLIPKGPVLEQMDE